MTYFEDMESIIEEWYSDCSINGAIEITKLYAHLDKLNENNMKQYFELKEKNKNDKL